MFSNLNSDISIQLLCTCFTGVKFSINGKPQFSGLRTNFLIIFFIYCYNVGLDFNDDFTAQT